MIETISGKICSLNPATVVIETQAGIGFLLNITIPTFSALQNLKETRLLVHENIREDAWTLYGFLTEDEREMFRNLTGVSGVGAASARLILSALPASELASVIASEDVKRLKSIKGIGTKTAERIIVDLKDKIKALPITLLEQPRGAKSPAYDEALEALVILGFVRAASQKALDKIFDESPDTTAEKAIKRAMTML